jgi:DNA-binding CsgD family transcriptional regulator
LYSIAICHPLPLVREALKQLMESTSLGVVTVSSPNLNHLVTNSSEGIDVFVIADRPDTLSNRHLMLHLRNRFHKAFFLRCIELDTSFFEDDRNHFNGTINLASELPELEKSIVQELRKLDVRPLHEYKLKILSSSITLTKKEKEIIHLISVGKEIKEIAHLLQISYKTAYNHRDSIRRKYGFSSSRQLEVFLLRQ